MIILLSIFTIYLGINILLIGSFVIFGLIQRISRLNVVASSNQLMVRTGQILFILSLSAPILLNVLPKRSLPEIEFGAIFHEIETLESVRTSLKLQNRSATQISHLLLDEKPKNNFTALIQRVFHFSNSGDPRLQTVFFLFWLLGFSVSVGYFIKNTLSLRQLLLHSIVVRKLGVIRVAISEEISVPFSFRGMVLNWVILPMNILERKRDLQIALKHELHHHRQRDTSWAIAMEFLICWFYMNPAIYLWKKVITELQELSCDEALIGQRGVSSYEYGSCLIRVAEAALENRKMYVGTTCMTADFKKPTHIKSFLRRRIDMLFVQKSTNTNKWVGIAAGTLGVLATVVIAYGTEQSNRKAQNKVNDLKNSGTISVHEKIQLIAEKALREAIRSEKATEGFAIVSDPNTGKILAIANIDSTQMKNGYWSLSQSLEPASLSKVLIVAQAIEKGKTKPQEMQNCENGHYQFGDRVYHDWNEKGWPTLSTEETITNSSNICAIKIGEKLGAEGLVHMLKDFGFGFDGTAKNFPFAVSGQLPPEDDSKHPKLIPYVSMGFGYRVTPIEMLQAYGAIANGGRLMKPRSADSPDSEQQVVRRVLSEESSSQMREILRQVVLKGTAKVRGESDLYTTAGKTATGFSAGAEESNWTNASKNANVAQFIGFAPVNNPRVEVYVGIKDPHTNHSGAHGSEHAAPVFKQIAEEVLKEMNVAPDKIQR